MKLLFFDIEITGHHSEYIRHLVHYIDKEQSLVKDLFIFVVHPDFCTRFVDITSVVERSSNIRFVSIKEEELLHFERKPLLKKSLYVNKLLKRYGKQIKPDAAFLLSINMFQLGLLFNFSSIPLYGILFKQFSRLEKSKRFDYTYFRKNLQTFLLSSKKNLKRVFILNDEYSANTLNKAFSTKIFRALPDPIPNFTPLPQFDIYAEYNIPRERKICLHIGSLSKRKGTIETIKSIGMLRKEHLEQTHLLLVGRAKPDFATEIEECIDKLNVKNHITWDNEFVSNEKMKSLFDGVSCVVMPYYNSEASSGILGHAAASGKPVIATGKGLLRELITDYKLGYLIDVVTPNNIAGEIQFIINSEEGFRDSNLSKEFVRTRRPEHFASLIIDTVINTKNEK